MTTENQKNNCLRHLKFQKKKLLQNPEALNTEKLIRQKFLMMVCNVYDFDPAQVVRNYAGSRGEDMDCKFYNKIYHFPFLITPQTMVKKKNKH